jgi:type I restriction enzyme, S subunit
MHDNENKTLTPKLRFPEFRERKGWEITTLGSVATFHKGRGISKAEVDSNGSRPCIRYGELYTRYGEVIDHVFSRTQSATDDLFFSRKNDVIIPASGETKLDIAKASCVMLDGVALGSDLNIIRTGHNGVFLSYFLNSTAKLYIARVAQGDAVVHLYPSQLEPLSISLPEIDEQQKVADCLTSLEEMIAAQGRKVEALKVHKKGLMQQLFPREAETLPRLRFREFQNSPEWEEKRLEKLATRGSGHTPTKGNAEYYDGGIKWVSLADSKRLDKGLISKTTIEISEQGIRNSSAVLHAAGSVILSRDAGVGKSAVMKEPMAVSQHFIVWTCDRHVLLNWFLYFVFQRMKPCFERVASGSTIKTIGLPFFIELRITVPRLPEQQEIVHCLRSLDDQIAAEIEKLDALKTHKKGLTQQLVPSPEEGL